MNSQSLCALLLDDFWFYAFCVVDMVPQTTGHLWVFLRCDLYLSHPPTKQPHCFLWRWVLNLTPKGGRREIRVCGGSNKRPMLRLLLKVISYEETNSSKTSCQTQIRLAKNNVSTSCVVDCFNGFTAGTILTFITQKTVVNQATMSQTTPCR